MKIFLMTTKYIIHGHSLQSTKKKLIFHYTEYMGDFKLYLRKVYTIYQLRNNQDLSILGQKIFANSWESLKTENKDVISSDLSI